MFLKVHGTYVDNDLLYNGEQYSEASGLYYLRARYMDPSTGRFISMDAYAGELNNPVNTHKYLYANANPVMYSDPSGYKSMAEGLTSMAIASALIGGLSGALLGALHADADPECRGWDRVWRSMNCAVMGAICGAAFTYWPMLIGPVSLYGMITSRLDAIEAYQKGYTKLGLFNNIMAAASAFSLGAYLGYNAPRVLEPMGTIPINESNASNTSEPLYKILMRERGIPTTLSEEEMAILDAYDYKMCAQNRSGATISRGDHAIIRSGQGRNVNTAINDLNKSGPSRIFLQEDGRIVIRGDSGRVHILEPDGEIVTTMNRVTNFNDRVYSGRYRAMTESERIEFVNKFDAYLGKAWDEYRDLN